MQGYEQCSTRLTSRKTERNVVSALCIAGILSSQLIPGLTAIKNAKKQTQECRCGKMAEGFGKPCLQPVCVVCSRDVCPECQSPLSKPDGKCPKHRGPLCPHKNCTSDGLKGFRGETSNSTILFDTVSEHINDISKLLDHLIVLTKDV
ncbi:hypothetical protein EV715DRAFT_271206 [Schizophyllum commune]